MTPNDHPMSEQECLNAIATGDVDAYDLLMEADPKLKAKFKALDKRLIGYLAEVQKHFPDACYYTASGGFHLMLGASHDSRTRGQQQLVALSGSASIGDGDF